MLQKRKSQERESSGALKERRSSRESKNLFILLTEGRMDGSHSPSSAQFYEDGENSCDKDASMYHSTGSLSN